MKNKEIYPVTIIKDRYDGVYSQGKWTAWPIGIQHIPLAQDDGDSECNIFWDQYDKPVGKGDTPDKAFADLVEVLKSED